jgi:hypothetical protein
LTARLLEQIRLAELDQHPFSTGRDEGRSAPDEQGPRPCQRSGHLSQLNDPGPQVWKKLKHGV